MLQDRAELTGLLQGSYLAYVHVIEKLVGKLLLYILYLLVIVLLPFCVLFKHFRQSQMCLLDFNQRKSTRSMVMLVANAHF